MRVAVYTLTRDRLDYTLRCFAALRNFADYPFDHFVVDNGSDDGTQEWLVEHQDEFKYLITYGENQGISAAANRALDAIAMVGHYDLILKIDNDCLTLRNGLIARIVQLYELKSSKLQCMLSPRVIGLNKQPARHTATRISGTKIGWVGQVGGLCHVLPGPAYQAFRYDEHLPKAWGQDEQICTWAHGVGMRVGYIEDLTVEHCETTEGQVARYPEYFERKWKEEELETPSPAKD